MASLAVRDPAVDRSLRSVFVGNIPYEATEEQLKDIFSEVGPVVSFRLVYDRETGKPKGYGFCEYQDQETALSAMRNLNGREFSGRALRVDNAASEKNKEELKNLGTGAPIIESPYGDPVSPEDAPESISRAVASLPPEQMFELMKQMKLCVQNSPQEARNMLLQNPQLAYALLQAQVVMRIVDPEIAVKILHRPACVPPLTGGSQQQPVPNAPLNQPNPAVSHPQPMGGMHVNGAPPMMQHPPMQGGVPASGPMPTSGPVAPGGVLQPQVGIPAGGPVPLERGQGTLQHSPVGPTGPAPIERVPVPMVDPRAPMQRGPPASSVPPRGLLGDGPNDPRGGTLLSVTGEGEPRGYLGPPHQGPPMHHVPTHETRGPPQHEMRGGPMGEPRPMMVEPRGPMMDQRGPPMDNRAGRDPLMSAAGRDPLMSAAGRDPLMSAAGRDPLMSAAGRDPLMSAAGRDPLMSAAGRDPLMSAAGRDPLMSAAGRDPLMSAAGRDSLMSAAGRDSLMSAAGRDPLMSAAGRDPLMSAAGRDPLMSAVGRDPRAMEPRGLENRGPGPGPAPRGPMPVGMQGPGPLNMGAAGPQVPRQVPVMQTGSQGGFSPGQNQVTPQDHEKAALIMQVLQLTPDQIAMLPPEQRQSILILKEQIQKSTGAP
ncbi:cleavage stimulation factor subunit 2 isoform X2 [Microcaecilia unicolor]|uniref:Cleavage stimulation factor subunit 2 isoform X2 n=1 Tax=Microcaecilia unicolor TaxID=1415580 RepID=A0A6P7YLS4_9AMPH|nr:cleavage stimulation factor subunit 2 isoform X2 [Microcaecilia unicolor]